MSYFVVPSYTGKKDIYIYFFIEEFVRYEMGWLS